MKSNALYKKYGGWAVVTGASDGIGKAFARELAAAGFSLVLVARRGDRLETLGRELSRQFNVECRSVAADLARPEAVADVLRVTDGLNVGLFVASAGFGTSGNFADGPLSEELAMVDVNCRAVVALTHAFANRFRERGGGGIVLLSSLVAFQGVARAAAYAATKAFIQTFAEGLRIELKPYGVDVLSVAPGPVGTGFGARANMNLGNGAEKPETVAREALAVLGRRTTVHPGFLAKFLELSLKPLPRFGRVLMMSKVMGGMTKHQAAQ
jgi:short-subunit dehydrogenase